MFFNRGGCQMDNENRRTVLKRGGAILTMGVLGSLGLHAAAAEHEGQMKGQKGVPAVLVSADQQGLCATCRFWGGIRRASEDKKTVACESLGWCSNPESANYQTMTTPVTGPMQSWKKWEAL
jgi:hypothetical protein